MSFIDKNFAIKLNLSDELKINTLSKLYVFNSLINFNEPKKPS